MDIATSMPAELPERPGQELGLGVGRTLAVADRIADEAGDHVVRDPEREIVPADQLVGQVARRAPEGARLQRHHLRVNDERAQRLSHQPERAHGGVAVQGDQVVGEREVEIRGEHRALGTHDGGQPADRLTGQPLHPLERVGVLLLRHDAARPASPSATSTKPNSHEDHTYRSVANRPRFDMRSASTATSSSM